MFGAQEKNDQQQPFVGAENFKSWQQFSGDFKIQKNGWLQKKWHPKNLVVRTQITDNYRQGEKVVKPKNRFVDNNRDLLLFNNCLDPTIYVGEYNIHVWALCFGF